ncbi:MAG: hypothetical protein ACI8X5_000440 [Planctomycetota bacterium]|jgi:hypothetical protein
MAKDVITVCPECGASIPKAGMSLCPYCASPLKKDPGKDQDRNPIVERLLKMEDKDEFNEALCETPPWTPEYGVASNRRAQGTALMIAGALMVLPKFIFAASATITILLSLGILIALLGLWMAFSARAILSRLDGVKIVKRSAFIIQRRSETGLKSGGSVTYHYTIQFGDGSEGEFSYVGRGVSEEPYTNGMTGVANTRGQELLHMVRVRS